MFSVPNLLSIVRMGLVPLFIIAVVDGEAVKALVVFVIAGVTDSLDGFIARFWGQQTLLGTYLDPLADKLLLTSAYVVLTIPALNPVMTIPVWVTVLVIARDVLIVLLAVVMNLAAGVRSFPPLKIGKITTTAQIVTVLVLLIGLAWRGGEGFPTLGPALIYATAALTVISGLGYVGRADRLVVEHEAEPPGGQSPSGPNPTGDRTP